MAAAVAVAEVLERDPVTIRAAKILVSLRFRELRDRPEWAPSLGTATARWEAYEPAVTPVEVPERWGRRRPRSCRSRPGSLLPWMKALRELELAGSGGVEAAPSSCGAAAGSGSPSTSSLDLAARAQTQPGDKAAASKEPMKAPSPDTPLDYGAGGSRASSSADDAARPPAKRRSPGARGSGGGGASSANDDDEGCSSPAKRPRVAAVEEKPIPMEQSMQSETSASSTKGIAFDLNLPPPDDAACPDAF